jgi:hypothetical protein
VAYLTGIATSPTDLLQQLVAWLNTLGWTTEMSQADTNGWRAHLSKSGVYVNLRANAGKRAGLWGYSLAWDDPANGIGIYTGTGHSAGSAWHAQPGGPIANGQSYTVGGWMRCPASGPLAFHAFDDGADNILVVTEITAGIFSHMGWGAVEKAGSWTGGAYFFGDKSSYASGSIPAYDSQNAWCPGSHGSYNVGVAAFVRADVDNFTGKWLSVGSQESYEHYGYTGRRADSDQQGGDTPTGKIPRCTSDFMARQVSSINAQANLVPIRWYAKRDDGGYSLLGRIPGIYASNATAKGYAIGEEILIGGDTYKVFPNFAVKKVG